MKIKFQSWVDNQGFSQDAKALFDESIKCYRVGAYRGAFLMSYVGFLVVVKERILSSPTPASIGETHWEEGVLKKLRNEDEWEKHTFEIISKKNSESKSKYLLLSNHLLSDLDYFKRRRNDCAHAKETTIDYSHVEVFWNFLQSHLAKFIVNGGKDGLLDKLEKHYDPKYTRPNTDPTHLVDEIPLVVEKIEIPDLLAEIDNKYVPLSDPFFKGDALSFWSIIAHHSNQKIHDGFIHFVAKEDTIFSVFMHYFPDKVDYFDINSSRVRYLWQTALFDLSLYEFEYYWGLPVSLLRNNKIPIEEKESFLYNLSKMVEGYMLPNDEEIAELNRHGFFQQLKKYIFEDEILKNGQGRYINVNNNSTKIIFYLENETPDTVVVRVLNNFFNGGYEYGRFKDELEVYMANNPHFLNKFNEIVEDQNINVNPFFKKQ